MEYIYILIIVYTFGHFKRQRIKLVKSQRKKCIMGNGAI